MAHGIDDKDYILLGLLKRNSRIPYSRIAEELGITESAVRKRLKRLIERGIIKRFTIDYSIPGELGALILVKTRSPKPVPEVSKVISSHHLVDKVVEVTGEYDIVAIARASSVSEINRLIDFIRGIDGVSETYTMIVLRSY